LFQREEPRNYQTQWVQVVGNHIKEPKRSTLKAVKVLDVIKKIGHSLHSCNQTNICCRLRDIYWIRTIISSIHLTSADQEQWHNSCRTQGKFIMSGKAKWI